MTDAFSLVLIVIVNGSLLLPIVFALCRWSVMSLDLEENFTKNYRRVTFIKRLMIKFA